MLVLKVLWMAMRTRVRMALEEEGRLREARPGEGRLVAGKKKASASTSYFSFSGRMDT